MQKNNKTEILVKRSNKFNFLRLFDQKQNSLAAFISDILIVS